MSERLGQKLERSPAPVPAPGAPPPRAVRQACLVVDEKCGFACEFQRTDGSARVLPYSQLANADVTADGAGLTVVFSTCEVRIAGEHLAKIKDVIARGRNLLVRATDPRWKSEFKSDEAFVSSLEIVERKSGGKKPGDAAESEAPDEK